MSSSVNSSRVVIYLKDKSNANLSKCGKVDVLPDNTLTVQRPKLTPKVFGPFQKILDKDISYRRVFYEVAKVHVDESFNGIKSYIISYGFSSSGKTDTLFGSDIKELSGILRETLEYINEKKCQDIGNTVDFYFSVFEICGDKIFDLLSDERKEVSIISDDDNKLVVKEPVVLPMLDLGDTSCTIRGALNRRSLASNTDFEIVSRSHVIVKLRIVTKNKRGIINYGEVVFVDLSSTNFIVDPTDKQMSSEIKFARMGYISLNLLLGKILKNPQPSQSFRESILTRMLRPALSGAYASSMVFTVTTDYVSADANQSLEIADKYRRLKCCPRKESLVSLKVRRNVRNIRVPSSHIEEVKMIELTPVNYESTSNIQMLHREIEGNKEQLNKYMDMLGKLEFDLQESSETCSERNLQREFYLKEKNEMANRLTKVNQENLELKSKVDKLGNEIKNLVIRLNTLKETCSKYFDKLEKSRSRGISLLSKDSSFNKAHEEMNSCLVGNIKDLECSYLEIKELSSNLTDKQKILMKELGDQYSQGRVNFKQVENSLKEYSSRLNDNFNGIEQSIKERLFVEVKNELYDKVDEVFNELLVAVEKNKDSCALHGSECFACIDRITEDEHKKITKFFSNYKDCLLQEICDIKEITSANSKYDTEMETAKNSIDELKKILGEIDVVQVPSVDLTKLSLPIKGKIEVCGNSDIHSPPKFTKTEKPDLINEVSSVTRKLMGNDYYNLLQGEENKENF
uniref:Kinesin motor domain-containing protein n=1 Tax=Strongyloides venezuelensis TaxID=75913 RepID=A0A0K0F857_STRVS